jgi:hypothetical protein
MTLDCYMKSMSYVRTDNLAFLLRLECIHSEWKSTKEVFNVQGAWHFPNMLPNLVHGQAFPIITWQLPIKDIRVHHQGKCWAILWVVP